jgi:uncharacterized membrane protein YbaN (DUF454 family)
MSEPDCIHIAALPLRADPGSLAVIPERYHGRMLTRLAALIFWRTLALASVALGLVGVILPGLPSVPFLLVAAWAGGKGWPQLEVWLLNHPRHGPGIRRWRDHRAVPRRVKWLATATMLSSTVLLALSSVPFHAKWGVPAFMALVAVWLWTRPEI